MFKGFLLLGTPVPDLIRASEVEEGSNYGQKVLDKATVEVNKAYESLHISLCKGTSRVMLSEF